MIRLQSVVNRLAKLQTRNISIILQNNRIPTSCTWTKIQENSRSRTSLIALLNMQKESARVPSNFKIGNKVSNKPHLCGVTLRKSRQYKKLVIYKKTSPIYKINREVAQHRIKVRLIIA